MASENKKRKLSTEEEVSFHDESLVEFKEHLKNWRQFLTNALATCKNAKDYIDNCSEVDQQFLVFRFATANYGVFELQEWIQTCVGHLQILQPPHDTNEGGAHGMTITHATDVFRSIFGVVKQMEVEESEWIATRNMIRYREDKIDTASPQYTCKIFDSQIRIVDDTAYRNMRMDIRGRYWAIRGLMAFLEKNLDAVFQSIEQCIKTPSFS